jgi:hypothetical protein
MKFIKCLFLFLCYSLALISLVYAKSNIVINLVVVNPSKELSQMAVVKSYLPKEVKGDDILNKGDLQAIYDAQEGAYYVYGEVQLKPAEVWEQSVELRDVWRIADAEILSLRSEAEKYVQILKGTDFSERIDFICSGVNKKLDQILQAQDLEPTNPEDRIFAHRDNLKLLESVRADLSAARGLLTQARPFSMKAVWSMILIIVAFLGVLGATFYFAWYRQATSAPLTSDFAPIQGKEGAVPGPAKREFENVKKETKNIDQVLNE